MSIFSKWFGSKDIEEQKEEIAEEVYFKEDEQEPAMPDPQDLPEAMRYIVEKWGVEYFRTRSFINILNDFHVLKEIPAAKNLLLNMHDNGYIDQITKISNWDIESKAIAAKYSTEFGAKEEIVLYLVKCIGYGLNYITEIPQYCENVEAPKPHINDSPNEPQIDISPVLEDLKPYDPKLDLENYKYPTLDLLMKYDNDGIPYIDMDEQNANKNRIVEVLRAFGFEISSIKAIVGPTVTLYEITLAIGVRISKIRSFEEDIALSLSAIGTRIIAPIPGKSTIGIEIPNAKPSVVSMESILNSKKFQETTMELPCAMGKTITNEVFMFDLAKAPHLLVAGATGQGKSVGLNAILTSLLYKKHPAEMKIVLVDPKMVEFSVYKTIERHFLAALPEDADRPIIKETTKVVRTLNSLCVEMDARFELLMAAGERNIKGYNKKFKERKLNPAKGHHYMPYIVVVIDEFGDLIMEAGKEIELPITNITQKGHIVGIHIILSTLRISKEIINKNIKLHIPSRIIYRVYSKEESNLLLEQQDAQALMGKGDFLYKKELDIMRVQGAFVDTPEVVAINKFISSQQSYGAPYELPDPMMGINDMDSVLPDVDLVHLDPLFEDAARLIVSNQSGSTPLIQRKFAIGYNRAGRLMDQLEKAGVVGPAYGSKPREVLIKDEWSLTNLLSLLR